MKQNNMELDSQKDESGVSVTRYKRKLGENDIEYALVSRSTADVDSLLTLISRYDTGVNRLMIQYCLGLFKRAVLEKLRTGRAVNMLGLGTMFISATLDKNSTPSLSVGFTPSNEARLAVSDLDLTVANSVSRIPLIEDVFDFYRKKSDGTVSKGYSILLSGKRLRLDDGKEEKAAVYFAPVDSDGNTTGTADSWAKVERQDLNRNKPSELEFYLPSSLEAGTYRMIVSTWYDGRKSASMNRTAEFPNLITVE